MVREIIHVQVGQCGNQIGNAFWNTMGKEHKLQQDGKFKGKPEEKDNKLRLDKIDVYYSEAGTMRFVPRACLVDLEPGIMDVIKASPMGALFKPDNMCFGASGAGNNWYAQIKWHIIHRSNMYINTQGQRSLHWRRRIDWRSSRHYPQRDWKLWLPSGLSIDAIDWRWHRQWNGHFSIAENQGQLPRQDHCHVQCVSFAKCEWRGRGEAERAQIQRPDWVISMVMSGITASPRFSGKLNGDLRKMGVYISFYWPRRHCLRQARAPKWNWPSKSWPTEHNFLANVKSEDGKYLTASCGYRGPMATQEVDDEVAKIQQKMAEDFVTWIPNNINSSIIGVQYEWHICVQYHCDQGRVPKESAQFAKMHKRKAFLHWYKGKGMDEMEFQEADKNVGIWWQSVKTSRTPWRGRTHLVN